MAVEQLPIRLSVGKDKTFENFHAAANAATVNRLQSLCAPPGGGEHLHLWGVSCAGKSHLLQAVCRRAMRHGRRGVFVPLKALIAEDAGLLAGLETVDIICVDDVDAAAGNARWEKALFDLINRVRARRCCLVSAGRGNPKDLPFALQDLSSRLLWGGVYRLSPLADADKPQALRLHAKERGCDVPDEVIRYLLSHHPRNMRYLADALRRLDHASLRDQRRVTVPLAREVLGAAP